jgi:hypothetical protein
VIAFGRGGATETVIPPGGRQEPTGLWFEEQTVECLASAVQQFEHTADRFDPAAARCQAQRFNHRRYADELLACLAQVLRPTGLPARRAA